MPMGLQANDGGYGASQVGGFAKAPSQQAEENTILNVDFVKAPQQLEQNPTTKPKVQAQNWDLETQQPHGGQEWSTISNFVDDFSVTTNFLGPPAKAVAACGLAIHEIEHYPPANFEPYLSELATWIQPEDPEELRRRLMLGNGASELIDLVIRIGAHKGPFGVKEDAQYKEYERAALADGRKKISQPGSGENFGLLAIINPCNPTGKYLPVEEDQSTWFWGELWTSCHYQPLQPNWQVPACRRYEEIHRDHVPAIHNCARGRVDAALAWLKLEGGFPGEPAGLGEKDV